MCQAHTCRLPKRPEHSYNWRLSRLSSQTLQSISSQAYTVYTNHSNRDTYSFARKKYTNDFADEHVPCLYTIHSNGLWPHNCPPLTRIWQFFTPSQPWQLPATINVCKTRGCNYSFELLMMIGVSLETCWAIKKHWNNKFYYTVASCWLFLYGLPTTHFRNTDVLYQYVYTFGDHVLITPDWLTDITCMTS
jgi:hypothetical protein